MSITLQNVAKLIKEDDAIIIENQEKGNETLKSMDGNLKEFLKREKDARGDRLEAERERNKLLKGLGKAGAVGMGAGGLGAESKKNLDDIKNAVSAIRNMELAALALKALSKGVGLALTALAVGGRALKDVFDDRLKTQRGLARLEAKELRQKMKGERLAARAAADAAKINERKLRADSANAHRAELKARAEAKALERSKKVEEAKAKLREADKLFEERELKKKLADRAANDRIVAKERGARAKGAEKAFAEARKARTARAAQQALDAVKFQADDLINDPRGRGQTSIPPSSRPSATPTVKTTSTTPAPEPKPSSYTEGKTKSSTSELSKYSDIDLETAGYKRVVGKNGTTTYRLITPGGDLPFAKHDDVLGAVKGLKNKPKVGGKTLARGVGTVAAVALAALDAKQGTYEDRLEAANKGKVSTNVSNTASAAGSVAAGFAFLADLGKYALKSAARPFTGASNTEVVDESFGAESISAKVDENVTAMADRALVALGVKRKIISAKKERRSLLEGFDTKEAFLKDAFMRTQQGAQPIPGAERFDIRAYKEEQTEIAMANFRKTGNREAFGKDIERITKGINDPKAMEAATAFFSSQDVVKEKMAELERLEGIIKDYETRAQNTVLAPNTNLTDQSTKQTITNLNQAGINSYDYDGALP